MSGTKRGQDISGFWAHMATDGRHLPPHVMLHRGEEGDREEWNGLGGMGR